MTNTFDISEVRWEWDEFSEGKHEKERGIRRE
jgi:hypothetical protein